MSKIKHMGASPVTGTIYSGTLDTEKGMWVGRKTDVTEMACTAVAEHLMVKKISKVMQLKDGREAVLNLEIRIPEQKEI